jgi:hypothetical protein
VKQIEEIIEAVRSAAADITNTNTANKNSNNGINSSSRSDDEEEQEQHSSSSSDERNKEERKTKKIRKKDTLPIILKHDLTKLKKVGILQTPGIIKGVIRLLSNVNVLRAEAIIERSQTSFFKPYLKFVPKSVFAIPIKVKFVREENVAQAIPTPGVASVAT